MSRGTNKRALKVARRARRKANDQRCPCGLKQTKERRLENGFCPEYNARWKAYMAYDGLC